MIEDWLRQAARNVAAAGLVVAGLAALPSSAQAADPDALWKIINDRCVPDQEQHGTPAPCTEVVLDQGIENGHVLMKDICGKTQFLLMPTAKISGIESSELVGAPNYFFAAWQARDRMIALAGRPVARDEISLAVNSAEGRSQNQLHIHIDLVRDEVRTALAAHQPAPDDGWFKLTLRGHEYSVRRVDDLAAENPFVLVADKTRAEREEMRLQTIVVVGATFADGKEGFYVLDGEASLPFNRGSGEELQIDHSDCKRPPKP
ncbi:MAG: CDP-diacylglycerol diphosphatase [Alphaproteobacteria bacterium]|nr:CDP-diacylglycerol diphosphatase [Alphaproteobacteria bacterium]